MGDENVGQAALALQALEQVENLGLDRDVKRGYRFVADDQVGLRRERAGDAEPLPLAAGELVGKQVRRLWRKPDLCEQPAHALVALPARPDSQQIERLANLVAGAAPRIERGERILKHDLQMPAHFAQRLAG